MKTNSSFLLFFCLIAGQVMGQSFELSGQLRPRTEYRQGYKSLIGTNIDPAFSISQRTRLNLLYSNNKLKSAITLQDVRVWGDVVTSNKSDLNGTMLYQAWGEYFFTEKFSMKVGRQPIAYDDQRLFGVSDWIQQARSHDAFLLKFNPTKTNTIQFGFAYNQSSDKDTGNYYSLVNNYKALQYLYIHVENPGKLVASFYLANLGMPASVIADSVWSQETRYSQTLGPILQFNGKKFKASASFYLQIGQSQKGVDKNALFLGGDIAYAPRPEWSVGAGLQYLSGNSQVDPDSKDREFLTLFSSGHKFNGWMDYFYAGSSHKGVGLLDIYLPVNYKNKKFSSELQLHYYRAAADVKNASDPAQGMDPYLGFEAGILCSYSFSPELTVSGGYSRMFGTETLQAVKGGDKDATQQWAWVMMSFSPTFFKVEK
jgi:hypothetical protein